MRVVLLFPGFYVDLEGWVAKTQKGKTYPNRGFKHVQVSTFSFPLRRRSRGLGGELSRPLVIRATLYISGCFRSLGTRYIAI